MYQNHQLFDWVSFTKSFELRFGPSTYANHQEELFKLRQQGSVSEYQVHFEKLCNRVTGLPSEAILNCFISGLIPEIRNELAIQRPQTIHQAIGLAKLIESKIKDSKPRYQKPFQTPTTSSYSRHNQQFQHLSLLNHCLPQTLNRLQLPLPNSQFESLTNPNYKSIEHSVFVIIVTKSL